MLENDTFLRARLREAMEGIWLYFKEKSGLKANTLALSLSRKLHLPLSTLRVAQQDNRKSTERLLNILGLL